MSLLNLRQPKSQQIDNRVLTEWLKHVAGIGTTIEIKLPNGHTHSLEPSPHYFEDCETCKQIAEYLKKFNK